MVLHDDLNKVTYGFISGFDPLLLLCFDESTEVYYSWPGHAAQDRKW